MLPLTLLLQLVNRNGQVLKKWDVEKCYVFQQPLHIYDDIEKLWLGDFFATNDRVNDQIQIHSKGSHTFCINLRSPYLHKPWKIKASKDGLLYISANIFGHQYTVIRVLPGKLYIAIICSVSIMQIFAVLQ